MIHIKCAIKMKLRTPHVLPRGGRSLARTSDHTSQRSRPAPLARRFRQQQSHVGLKQECLPPLELMPSAFGCAMTRWLTATSDRRPGWQSQHRRIHQGTGRRRGTASRASRRVTAEHRADQTAATSATQLRAGFRSMSRAVAEASSTCERQHRRTDAIGRDRPNGRPCAARACAQIGPSQPRS